MGQMKIHKTGKGSGHCVLADQTQQVTKGSFCVQNRARQTNEFRDALQSLLCVHDKNTKRGRYTFLGSNSRQVGLPEGRPGRKLISLVGTTISLKSCVLLAARQTQTSFEQLHWLACMEMGSALSLCRVGGGRCSAHPFSCDVQKISSGFKLSARRWKNGAQSGLSDVSFKRHSREFQFGPFLAVAAM